MNLSDVDAREAGLPAILNNLKAITAAFGADDPAVREVKSRIVRSWIGAGWRSRTLESPAPKAE